MKIIEQLYLIEFEVFERQNASRRNAQSVNLKSQIIILELEIRVADKIFIGQIVTLVLLL